MGSSKNCQTGKQIAADGELEARGKKMKKKERLKKIIPSLGNEIKFCTFVQEFEPPNQDNRGDEQYASGGPAL